MNHKKPPRPLLILGWITIVAVPVAFFIFGWRDIKLTCRRPLPGAPPTCQISESFAMGLYTRQVTAEQATGVSFQVRRSTTPGSAATSTVVLATPGGEAAVSRVASNVDGDAKRELIGKMQEFLDTPEALELRHHAKMHSIFGWLGTAGLAGLAILLLAVVWSQVRKSRGRGKSEERPRAVDRSS